MIESAARLFDPFSLLLVTGGTVMATLISSTGSDLRRALAALRPLLRARPESDGRIADHSVRQIQRILDFKGIVCVDRVKTPIEFVREAARRLAEAEASCVFHAWAEQALEDRRARHDGAIGVWRTAAEIAPAMGMIGTVIGLVLMFAGMSDPAAMAPAMAAAMLTTLYGLILAACLAGPVAARLERLSEAERRWQRQVIDRLEVLARAEDEAMNRWVGQRAGTSR
jgi:chemotaxis protein MotA